MGGGCAGSQVHDKGAPCPRRRHSCSKSTFSSLSNGSPYSSRNHLAKSICWQRWLQNGTCFDSARSNDLEHSAQVNRFALEFGLCSMSSSRFNLDHRKFAKYSIRSRTSSNDILSTRSAGIADFVSFITSISFLGMIDVLPWSSIR